MISEPDNSQPIVSIRARDLEVKFSPGIAWENASVLPKLKKDSSLLVNNLKAILKEFWKQIPAKSKNR